MPSLVGRRWLVTSLAVFLGLLPGCLAPTLPPLPPPQAKVSAPVDGEVEVTGEVRDEDAGAMVLALNQNTGQMGGVLMEAEQTEFSFKLRADVDQVVTVFYLAHNEQSEAVDITVRAAEPSPDAGAP
jgi:hypothetical protein